MRVLGILLLLLATVGTLGPAVACLDECPEDEGAESCPPVCSLCVQCPRAAVAVIDSGASVVAGNHGAAHAGVELASIPDAPPRDILHVPLPA